ncbi:MAG TPA: rhomboid family intramembrane serine protease, partial [Chthoniobacteraceae bacterium]
KFRETPQTIDFREAAGIARRKREEEERREKSRRSTVADAARVGYEQNFSGAAYLTWGLIIACVALAIYSQLGDNKLALSPFLITPFRPYVLVGPDGTVPFLPEVWSGEIWRLITPIFIHFGLPHILFNSMAIKDLGTFIEGRFGTLYFGLLVLAFGILSNIGQSLWYLHGPPYPFGGMSGVNYGLLGFLWIRGRFDPRASWQLNKTTVQIMLAWFFLCYTGIFGNVANTAHAVGLICGMAWGYASSGRLRFSR